VVFPRGVEQCHHSLLVVQQLLCVRFCFIEIDAEEVDVEFFLVPFFVASTSQVAEHLAQACIVGVS
jgi:hypothetical protein